MSDILKRIKRAVLAGNYRITQKAQIEMYRDNLDESDVLESLIYATEIKKTLKSTSLLRGLGREHLHVIISDTLDGTIIYTKGKLSKEQDVEFYYVCVSAKRAVT